ncbi:transposon Ty3-G Gag-Pol polyprotein [Trichonephila clavipes]|nr:transposon Ty3-G Gag-Pol polyprotein [Trichonephila clavipes]
MQQLSFKASKEAIAKATLLKHPIPGAQLSLWVDASNVAVGGSLMQLSNDQWEPLAFYSSKLNKSQKNWSTYDRSDNTVADALSRIEIDEISPTGFGCPTTITTDRSTNFESNLFRELPRMLGCNRIHSTSYHPQANSIIERLHRHLKGALKAHNHIQWTELLPIVLLDVTDHSDLVQTQTIIEKPVTAAPNPSIPYTTRYGRKNCQLQNSVLHILQQRCPTRGPPISSYNWIFYFERGNT